MFAQNLTGETPEREDRTTNELTLSKVHRHKLQHSGFSRVNGR